MPRNTNIDELLFPVGLADIFIEGKLNHASLQDVRIPVERYKAVINQENGEVLSVVTNNYMLISNEEAIELGKECYKKVFNIDDTEKFEIFNIIAPSTKSFCHIDIIHKGYEVNIGKQEVYLPYMRVTNSYNKQKALSFDLGFCRKLCFNGVIFETESIKFFYYHTKQAIESRMDFEVLPDQLERLKNRFIAYSNGLRECQVPRKMALPLMCKVLGMNPDVLRKTEQSAEGRDNPLRKRAEKLIDSYYSELGDNAYAVFNACTEYATFAREGTVSIYANSAQRRVGRWLEGFNIKTKESNFNLEDYVGDYAKRLN